MSAIAIAGASGQLGRRVTELLLERGVAASDLVLVTRSPQSLADAEALGADVRHGDFDDPSSLATAFAGVDRLLLISTDAIGRRLPQHKAAIDAAVEAGVGHVIYTSAGNPVPDNPVTLIPEHRGTEEALQASGLAWTILRNALYSDFEIPGVAQALATGQLVANTGEGTTAYVTREDCAAAAAGVLAGEGHEGRVYDITGPELLSAADKAALAAELGEREVQAVLVDDDALTAGLLGAGLPEEMVGVLVSFGRAIREGYMDQQSDAVEMLAGRPPQSLRDFLLANRDGLAAPTA